MRFAFPPSDPISLPIAGGDKRFPVRRIYCVGKNYADHVAEMGGDVERSEPVFFTKAAETIVQSGAKIPYPPHTENLHYEVELVVAIGPDGIFGYGVGIDMTRRDLQAKAKAKGGPWARAKNFPYCEKMVILFSTQLYPNSFGQWMRLSNISPKIWTSKLEISSTQAHPQVSAL